MSEHTPKKDLTHTENCGIMPACQSKNITAKHTDTQMPTSIVSNQAHPKDCGDGLAVNAALSKSSVNGKKSNSLQSPHMGESVNVAAKQSHDSLQSTISMGTAKNTEKQSAEDTGCINGLQNKATPKKNIASCASTAIVPGANMVNARTKNSFTPGPWASGQQRGNNAFEFVIYKEVGPFPGKLASLEFVSSEKAEANACLIAACPTMYDYISQKAHDGDEKAIEIISALTLDS